MIQSIPIADMYACATGKANEVQEQARQKAMRWIGTRVLAIQTGEMDAPVLYTQRSCVRRVSSYKGQPDCGEREDHPSPVLVGPAAQEPDGNGVAGKYDGDPGGDSKR